MDISVYKHLGDVVWKGSIALILIALTVGLAIGAGSGILVYYLISG